MQGPPRPCAGVRGTTITVEDLFYNVPTRRKALKGGAEEYSRLLDVLGRYAALNASVAISCRRHGDARADLATPGSGARLDAIRAVFGSPVAASLLPIAASREGDEAGGRFALEGYASSANYAAKRMTFVLFINSRLVDCAPLKARIITPRRRLFRGRWGRRRRQSQPPRFATRPPSPRRQSQRACDAIYSALLPKADKPFLLMSLELPPEDVDVNVHPTKKEVTFLNQEAVIECVQVIGEGLQGLVVSFTRPADPHPPHPPSFLSRRPCSAFWRPSCCRPTRPARS